MGKKIDLAGQRFGRLTALEEVRKNKYNQIMWKCFCDCDNETIVRSSSLRSGHTQSCGCLNREKISETCKINLIGQRFGRLLVLEEAGKDRWQNTLWKCLCNCNIEKIVSGRSLRCGDTKSCGCLRNERVSETHSGEKHFRYNPNLTDEERQVRREYPEYEEWRKTVYERDNYTCQCCDQPGGKLAAHHLNGYDNFPELRTLLENGITLCEECHKNFHHQYGKGNNTKEQFEEFLIQEPKRRKL